MSCRNHVESLGITCRTGFSLSDFNIARAIGVTG
jgi:hypothetical protein